ncbi:DUF6113 family protein [Microbacterium sp. M3]|uniref:DUF6113 family protein n=1 Tax=Microbacterium arthrosphaerae TaxID=792652 RepID=A0ABU4GZW3_9MICO|nr:MULTISPECIES: DUF6113 family protein [Microbacterium]MDW4571159.1 DUF6113 family protein [Microbacterium arthrosphaerae]MDW7605014.1 DUF6113 family protein [Microbacterium sp. M3]
MTFSWSRLGAWVVAFVVGAFYGVAGTVAQAYMIGWFPLGLVLGLIGVIALLVAVRLLTGDRWATLATALGVMIATLVFSGAGPGGSVVVPQAPEGQFNPGVVWTILVPLAAVVVIAWPEVRSRTAPPAEPVG